MQQPDNKKFGGEAPPPYPGATGYAAGGFVAPPPEPGSYAPPPQQAYGAAYGQQQGPPPMGPANPGYAAQGGNLSGGYDSDVEGGNFGASGGMGFSEKAIRRGFIRKVYGILSLQLIVTFGIIMLFTHVEGLRLYARRNKWMYWTGFATTMVCMIAMVCCESARRKAPTNFIFLGIFTVAEGFMLGSMCAFFDAEAIWIAVAITVGVTLALTIFAFQTKIDFTACGGMLCALLMALVIAGFFLAFMPKTKYTMIGYGVAGALIFSLYIIYDTQLMMGGKHKYALDPEEYVFASLNIYLDVINLFLYILMIVGGSRSD